MCDIQLHPTFQSWVLVETGMFTVMLVILLHVYLKIVMQQRFNPLAQDLSAFLLGAITEM